MSLPINSLYSLTWGDYGTSLVSAVQLLRCHGDLVDCTLAAGGRSFPAHKIVLCAASPFLLDLLKNTPCKHPIVMLAGVNANDLEALLEFVYRGEVSVDHSQLPSLLQAAHCLNIQGLAPQTVSKDDYTQIQLHPHTLLPQHHVKAVIDVGNGNMVNVNEYGEELITTIEESPHTVHAHVVEDIIQQDPLGEVDVNDVKDTITQFLPTRKRRPRVTKKAVNAKVQKLDENNMQTITTMNTATVPQPSVTAIIPNAVKKFENGDESMVTIMTTTAAASSATTLTSPSVTINTTQTTPATTPMTPAKSTKAETSATKPKSRSQSEQPASCPICGAVIRQSRNLRRHLELRHFSKGVKKDKKIILDTGTIVTASGSVITSGTNLGGTISTSGIGNNTTSTLVNTSTGGNIIATVPQIQTISVVKKEHTDEEILSTTGSSNQPQTITVSMAPNQTHHTLVDANSILNSGNQPQHVVTQHENSDGTTSLSIAQVQTVQGHQLTLGGLNQGIIQIHNNSNVMSDDKMEHQQYDQQQPYAVLNDDRGIYGNVEVIDTTNQMIKTEECLNVIMTHEPTLRPQNELYSISSTAF